MDDLSVYRNWSDESAQNFDVDLPALCLAVNPDRERWVSVYGDGLENARLQDVCLPLAGDLSTVADNSTKRGDAVEAF